MKSKLKAKQFFYPSTLSSVQIESIQLQFVPAVSWPKSTIFKNMFTLHLKIRENKNIPNVVVVLAICDQFESNVIFKM